GSGVDPIDPSLELEDAPTVSLEAQGGIEWSTGSVALMAAASWSAVRAVGSPDVRALFGLGWVSAPSKDKDGDGLEDPVDRCPDDEEDLDGFEDEDGCPDLDDDGDGVPDEDDKCPRVAGVSAERGCPSKVSDSDGDGLDDASDQCPGEAEDKDGFADEDGCPDPDNDGDGVRDEADACPGEAEDKDGFRDEDGCPDPDNDGDGVPDTSDKCPDRPEVKNGLDDADGCPDTTLRDVALGEATIELKKPVLFAGDKVRPDSLPILDQLAQLLNEHRYLTKVRIESHTDSEGDAKYNLALTQRRADAVVSHLVKKGVAADRLVAQGFGEDRPLMPNDRPDRRAKNRRVEVHLLAIDGKPVAP
ncbi:MAG TPA: OmpA family protein, partial [Myxococcota bacterium]|nr:OmpA family protein [Myxococcota bacterium]